MSGGSSHNRQTPAANNAWNRLQVPNYFPSRQPQHAHMPKEHPLLHQSNWHTPTTEPLKTMPQSHIFSLEQMLSERQFSRHTPGVDLSTTRNTNQNGELPTTPISLSVRDTNKINSLHVSAFDIQPVEANAVKRVSPDLKGSNSCLPTEPKKRLGKRVDLILERLNPSVEKVADTDDNSMNKCVIVPATGLNDENSNSSGILNMPSQTNLRDEEVGSPCSNEDSFDSSKPRRKRKPSKTVRLQKGIDAIPDGVNFKSMHEESKKNERRRSLDDRSEQCASKNRRKTSSESETIDNIAAMVEAGLSSKERSVCAITLSDSNVVPDVLKSKDESGTSALMDGNTRSNSVTSTGDNNGTTNTQFVEVENKLEEMFAGIEDSSSDPLNVDSGSKLESSGETHKLSCSNNNVTSTSNELKSSKKKAVKKPIQNQRTLPQYDSEHFHDSKKKTEKKTTQGTIKKKMKTESSKDVCAYDSGSNTSSNRSRGPFIQIRGFRDSPLSVNVVNTSVNEEDTEKKSGRVKKYHDDNEYRQKVRTKGLHCSTLSNQYDAQTKDTSWICAFCKRGPHSTEFSASSITYTVPATGDLFGPYIISTKSLDFKRMLDDPYDIQFKSKRVAKVVESSITSNVKFSSKKKRKHSLDLKIEDDMYFGLTDTGCGTFEIWAHEECIVWSPGIYLIGPKIMGLEEAVWTSCNVICMKCGFKGANISCARRGCLNVAHIFCARFNQWQLDDVNYKTFCSQHGVL